MMIYVLLFFNCIFCQWAQAVFNFNKCGEVVVKTGSTLTLNQPVTITSGEVVVQAGAVLTGTGTNYLTFAQGSLVDRASNNQAIEGSFVRHFDATTLTDTINLTNGQTLKTSGPVLSQISVSGIGNSITGSPKLSGAITLAQSPVSSLAMGILSDCDVSIELGGGTLSLIQSLKMSPGTQISSGVSPGTIVLNDQTLSIGGATAAWAEDLIFTGPGTINLYSDLALLGTWTLNGNVTIFGNGGDIDLSNSNAQLIIGANSVLELDSISLNGFQSGKVVFTDATSVLKISKSHIAMSGNYDQTVGALITENSTIAIGTNYWKLASGAGFTNYFGELWFDTLGDTGIPTFGQTSSSGTFTSFLNNTTVKQIVDFEQVNAASNRLLTGGNVDSDINVASNLNVSPASAIVATSNVTINSPGTAINFANTGQPQLIVNSGNQLTLAGDHTLNIQSNTISVQTGATLAVSGSTIINAGDDVSIPTGTIAVSGQSTMTINGSSNGNTKFGLSSTPGQPAATMDVGTGSVLLRGVNFYNVEQATVSSQIINGVLVKGQFILGGGSTVHITKDCHMNFLVQGEGNTLVLQNPGITFYGTITFENYDTNELFIKFDLPSEDDPMTLSFANNSMQLFSSNGFARLTFEDRDVTVTNLSPNSFVTGGHAYLGGNTVTISENPIVQSSSDLGLGTTLHLENDTSITNPFVTKSTSEFLIDRSPEFINAFKFPHLPKYENFFKSKAVMSRTPSAAAPTLRVTNVVAGMNTGVLKVYQSGTAAKFAGSDPLSSLEVQLTGDGTVASVPRRQARAVVPVKSPDFADAAYTDTLKPADRIYVSGAVNNFTITGNLDFNAQLYLDASSELIFTFDDSLNTPKAILFRPVDQNGKPYVYMPPSSSIVFSGSGQVIFDPYLQIDFGGDAMVAINAALGVYQDDRPSFIFKNYAQMVLDQGQQLSFFGKGNLLFQSNAKLNLILGSLSIGNSSTDLFSLSFDRQSTLTIGAITYSGNATAAIASSPARLSLAYGSFSLKFTKESTLSMQNGGILELALQNGVYTTAEITEFSFSESSTLNLQGLGRLAIGQASTDLIGTTNTNMYFDNLDSTAQGTGLLSFFTPASSALPLFEGQMQPGKNFLSESASPYYLFTELLRITKLRSEINPNPNQLGLILAVDYIDINGNYQLRNANGVTVPLLSGDTIRREAPQGGASAGTVFGTSASGVNFSIALNGTRSNG